jgi:glyoxylate/hydroxypyruvate reductase
MPRPKVLVTHREVPDAGLKLLKSKYVCLSKSTPYCASPSFIFKYHRCELYFCDEIFENRSEILHKCKGMDGILWATHITPLNAEVLDAAGPQLRAISTISSGVDYVDVAEFKKRGIALGHTPAVLNDAVADIAVGLMIAAARRVREGRLKIVG